MQKVSQDTIRNQITIIIVDLDIVFREIFHRFMIADGHVNILFKFQAVGAEFIGRSTLYKFCLLYTELEKFRIWNRNFSKKSKKSKRIESYEKI